MIKSLINKLSNINTISQFKNVPIILEQYSEYINYNNIYNLYNTHNKNNKNNKNNINKKKMAIYKPLYYNNTKILSVNENQDYVKFLFFKKKILESYFIFWKPNSKSRIHNHAKQGCYFTVLNNTLEEHVYNKNIELTQMNVIQPYEINYIDDTIGYHKIINNSNNFSVSLHIYSPPNSDIQIFD